MSDIFNNIFEGIKIGRRETRLEFSGLVREMCDMLDHLAPEIDDDFADDRIEAEKLIARAKAVLDALDIIEKLGGMDPLQRAKE